MEKIIERDVMKKVMRIVDKHLNNYIDLFDKARDKKHFIELVMDEIDTESYDQDMENYASAIACLIMLKKELSGEIEY